MDATGLRWQGKLAVYAPLVVASLVLLALFGGLTRPPFDDEAITLLAIEGEPPATVFARFVQGGLHPPLSYTVFAALHAAGLGFDGLRLVCFAFTVLAVVAVVDVFLSSATGRRPGAGGLVLLAALCMPIVYGVGDAVRWYPLFACLLAAALWCYARSGRLTLGCAAALGLAASTSYLAILGYAALAVDNYAVRRRLAAREALTFHAVVVAFALPGLMSFAAAVGDGLLAHVLQPASLAGLGRAALGWLGGYRVGLVDGVLLLPFLAVVAAAVAAMLWSAGRSALDAVAAARAGEDGVEAPPEAGRRCLALLVLLTVGFAIAGHVEPRSYLYLAPMVAVAVAELALAFAEARRRLTVAAALPLAVLVFAANAKPMQAPFKRSYAIVPETVARFVRANTAGPVLVVSSELTVAYALRADPRVQLVLGPGGPWPEPAPRSVAVIRDHTFERSFAAAGERIETLLAEAERVAAAEFFLDREAGLKSRLSGASLPRFVIRATVYRRAKPEAAPEAAR